MRPDLQELVDSQTAAVTPASGWPSPQPADGATRAQWLDEVAQLRQQHDAMALEALRRIPAFPGPAGESEGHDGLEGLDEAAGLRIWFDRVPLEDTWRSVKVYRPVASEAALPAVLLLHGGGWWMGGGAAAFEIGDPLCRRLAHELGAVVVSLDYRLAPEHRFPAALVDAETTVRWMHATADELGIDRERVAVYGSSAGANIAAALARRLRRTDHALALQVLHVPALDLRFATGREAVRSWEEEGTRLREYYLASGTDVTDPEVSPVLAPEAVDLPPAVVVVGTHDPLRDDGVAYDLLLRDSGVASTCLEYEMTHGIATPDVARAWLGDAIAESRRVLSGEASVVEAGVEA